VIRRLVLLGLIALAAAAVARSPASAHATLAQSIPADRAQLAQAPSKVDLYFSQRLVQSHTGTFAIVLDPAGQQVSGEASIDPRNGTHLVVPLRPGLDAGTYVVFWKSTSDDDGGVSLGNFSFVVGQGQAAATAAAGLASGEVLVPDEQRARALTESPPPSGGVSAWLFGLGVAGSAALGAFAAWGLLTIVRRRRPAPPRAARGRRG
jgi:methionine-rich copper-binding protein CopC